MKYSTKSPAILLLEDGTVFHGKSGGASGIATGEVCFNTGMTGYQEIFTDPSYHGQLMVMASVHIGNYGVQEAESESSKIRMAGLICRNLSTTFSRAGNTISVQEFLAKQNIVVMTDVDTRAIVRHIRSRGAMNAIISTNEMNVEVLKKELRKVPSMDGLELSSKVSTGKPYFFGNPAAIYKVAVMDEGVKFNTLRNLSLRNCYVQVFNYDASFEQMQAWNPDGYLISNGPGDPAPLNMVVDTVRKIVDADVPVFGICLGHQLLAQAVGITTMKMHHGHRGINHPVKNVITGGCEITSQNHGFGISKEGIEKIKNVEVTHVNLNDGSIEGIRIKNKNAFSVQYHPEAAPGPHDAEYLFDDFIEMIRQSVQSNREVAEK